MDFIDMDSYKWRQYAQEATRPMRWIYQHEAKYLMAYEAKIANAFQHVFFVTEAEKNLFLHHIPCDNAKAIGNGVDLGFFHPSHESPLKKNGPALVFTGAMDYPPNIEGISWFSEKIFPLVRKTVPDLFLYVVGSRPTEKVLRLDRQAGVRVTGYVEDIRDYLAMADICIAPLRIARGIQNKVLEAMAMGKATVCTPEALEGIPARPGEHLVVADGEEPFAAQLVRLLTDRAAAAHLGKQARCFIEKEFSWDAQLTPLDTFFSR
jgi:sugar transferase (PEP-CTERM/EpsH1 system associated)